VTRDERLVARISCIVRQRAVSRHDVSSVADRRVRREVGAVDSCRERIGSASVRHTATSANSRARERRVPRPRERPDAAVADFKVRTVCLDIHAATMRNAAQEFAPVDFEIPPLTRNGARPLANRNDFWVSGGEARHVELSSDECDPRRTGGSG
jgi:hypothetical protein